VIPTRTVDGADSDGGGGGQGTAGGLEEGEADPNYGIRGLPAKIRIAIPIKRVTRK
jgi:hypothetical protein